MKFEKQPFSQQMDDIGVSYSHFCFMGGRKAKQEKKIASLS